MTICGDRFGGFVCDELPGHDPPHYQHMNGAGVSWPVQGTPLEPEPAEEPLPDPGADALGRFHAEPHPTEVAGAVAAIPNTGSQRRLILDAIAAAGEDGLTHDELAEVEGVSDRAHRTRRKELEDDGWVEDSGRTRLTETRTDAVVWVLTKRGLSQYESVGYR